MKDLNRIITKYNRDINGNPVTNHIIRRYTVSSENYQVVLDFIPSESLGVRILEPENVYQIYNSDELVEGTFYVDNISGKVFFDKTMASKEILIDYYSVGLEMIGCERVYTCISPNGDVLETLGDILNDGKEILETLKTMGDIVVVIEELKKNIKIGNDVYERLGLKIDVATKLLQDLTAKNTEIRQTIADAETKKQEVIVVTNNAETKKQEVNTTISNADSKKRELESTISSANTKKSELESTISTSSTKKSELQIVINNSDTKKSELQQVINDSVTKKEELQTVIDNGDVAAMKSDIESIDSRTSGLMVKGGELKLGDKTLSNTNTNILWDGREGGWTFDAGKTITLSKKITDMPNGLLTLWSTRNSGGTVHNWHWVYGYIPKQHLSIGGALVLPLAGGMNTPVTKMVYITDTTISGHDSNNDSAASSNLLVLRKVFEW